MLFGGSRIQILNTALFNRPSLTIRFPARSAREDLDQDLVEVLVRRSAAAPGEILSTDENLEDDLCCSALSGCSCLVKAPVM